jgi:hypothetical protein
VIAPVSGRVSTGKTTFYTRAELLRMLFVDLVSASEKARKGMSPQYRYKPKFSPELPSTSLNLIPTSGEKIKVRRTITSKGLKSALAPCEVHRRHRWR